MLLHICLCLFVWLSGWISSAYMDVFILVYISEYIALCIHIYILLNVYLVYMPFIIRDFGGGPMNDKLSSIAIKSNYAQNKEYIFLFIFTVNDTGTQNLIRRWFCCGVILTKYWLVGTNQQCSNFSTNNLSQHILIPCFACQALEPKPVFSHWEVLFVFLVLKIILG